MPESLTPQQHPLGVAQCSKRSEISCQNDIFLVKMSPVTKSRLGVLGYRGSSCEPMVTVLGINFMTNDYHVGH